MYVNYGYIDFTLQTRVDELRREAEHDRLVYLAIGPGRPLRIRLADWLYAVAERIEGTPRQPAVRAQA